MKIFRELQSFPQKINSCVLTIGNFDGVHRGHQKILNRMKEVGYPAVALTFENHPSTVLRPDHPLCCISTTEHRIKLLKTYGIDLLGLLRFTQEFSRQTAHTFLSQARQYIPFTHLILGHDAALGKDRHGDPKIIRKLGDELGFDVEYIQEFIWKGETVSSSKIRQLVEEGKLQEATDLLGRSYSIYSQVTKGSRIGSQIGFHTANLNVDNLCLPPFGVYAVKVLLNGSEYSGIANLGIAPTIHDSRKVSLEVHIFDLEDDLYEKWLEVIPTRFIRPEKKFDDREELQKQIALDIRSVKDSQ